MTVQANDKARAIHIYVAEGPDHVWIKDKYDSLNTTWDPDSDLDVGATASRLVSETFNDKGFEFLNSADKAYDPKSRAFYFLIMLNTSGAPTAASSDMDKVKVSWLINEINAPADQTTINQDSFKHFKLLHKRV